MTVFVLGAGASRHAGYPFANSMGQELLSWMKAADSGVLGYPAAAESLEEVFGAPANFEDLLTSIQSLIRDYEGGTPEQRATRAVVAQARCTLVQALREWFAEIREHSSDVYAEFARDILQPGDTVLTFNYDVMLDRELKRTGKWSVGDGYGFMIEGFPGNSSVKELKLHGSTNWLAVMFAGKTGFFQVGGGEVFGTRPVIPKNELEFLEYPDLIDPQFPNASAPLPVLIMPARSKEFFFQTNLGVEWNAFWDSIWEQAVEALEQAEKIVICGYGLLPVDQHACDLLFEAPNRTQKLWSRVGLTRNESRSNFGDMVIELKLPRRLCSSNG